MTLEICVLLVGIALCIFGMARSVRRGITHEGDFSITFLGLFMIGTALLEIFNASPRI